MYKKYSLKNKFDLIIFLETELISFNIDLYPIQVYI